MAEYTVDDDDDDNEMAIDAFGVLLAAPRSTAMQAPTSGGISALSSTHLATPLMVGASRMGAGGGGRLSSNFDCLDAAAEEQSSGGSDGGDGGERDGRGGRGGAGGGGGGGTGGGASGGGSGGEDGGGGRAAPPTADHDDDDDYDDDDATLGSSLYSTGGTRAVATPGSGASGASGGARSALEAVWSAAPANRSARELREGQSLDERDISRDISPLVGGGGETLGGLYSPQAGGDGEPLSAQYGRGTAGSLAGMSRRELMSGLAGWASAGLEADSDLDRGGGLDLGFGGGLDLGSRLDPASGLTGGAAGLDLSSGGATPPSDDDCTWPHLLPTPSPCSTPQPLASSSLAPLPLPRPPPVLRFLDTMCSPLHHALTPPPRAHPPP